MSKFNSQNDTRCNIYVRYIDRYVAPLVGKHRYGESLHLIIIVTLQCWTMNY